jgi:hypothetical protein
MDEYTADPKQTEREAQRVLRQMRNDNARAEVSNIGKEVRAEKEADRKPKKDFGHTRAGGGGGGDFSGMKGLDKPFKAGGSVSSASKRADGCCIKGKTKGRMV